MYYVGSVQLFRIGIENNMDAVFEYCCTNN
jgi:hypothetical protein